jgi:hypothetical protein
LVGYFFFFLAKSSIDAVGSAPADNKYRTGSRFELSYQIDSIVYAIGSVNSFPRIAPINWVAAIKVLSSLMDLTKQS